MEDLRLWFLESRICRLWNNIPEESWTEFLSEDGRKNRKHLMEFLDAPHNNEVEIKIFGSGLFIQKNNPF